MVLSLLKDFFLFLFVALVIGVAFTFTNCGEEAEFSNMDLEAPNFVYIKYTDSQGAELFRKAEFKEANGDIYIDGDVLIGSAESTYIGDVVEMNHAVKDLGSVNVDGIEKREALKSNKAKIWPQGIVPYKISNKMSNFNKEALLLLIEEFNTLLLTNKIKLELMPLDDEQDYIHFLEMNLDFPSGGQSFIGRVGGAQALKIREDNFNRTVVHHEILHALGFKHEHQRSDRKLKINKANITSSQVFNFSVYQAAASVGKYDHESIMHYHSYAFSKNDEPTMLTLDGNFIPRNRRLSAGDLYSLKEIYGETEAMQDGVYAYKGSTYYIFDGNYCQLRANKNENKLIKMSQANFNTMKSHGLMDSLIRSPFCDQ